MVASIRTMAGLILAGCLALGVAPPPGPATASAHARASAYADAVRYCRNHSRKVHLSEDTTVLCYDGKIPREPDLMPMLNLASGGLFVVRSPGGMSTTAMTIADILWEKGASVIIYDYCLSACAGFFFIAALETYVARGSVVAWHAPCGGAPEKQFTHAELEKRCNAMLPRGEFFLSRADRTQSGGSFVYTPQSAYTRKMVRMMYDGSPYYRDVFWMWNPRFHANTFKTRIIYEAYPHSQDEVDEIAKRFRLPHIVWDP